MRILVTGAGGIVGSHVAEHFAKRGDQVMALEREGPPPDGLPAAAAEAGLAVISALPPVTVRRLPAFTVEAVREAIGPGVDAAVQALAAPLPGAPGEALSAYFSSVVSVLEACASLPKPPALVHVSSMRVYGGNLSRVPVLEEGERYRYAAMASVPEIMPVDQAQQNPAAAAGAAADIVAQAYGYSRGLRTAVFRIASVAGRRPAGPSGMGWVARFAAAALLERPLSAPGGRKVTRDILDAEDVVLAVRAFLDTPTTAPLVLNLGGGPERVTSYGEVLDRLQARTGKPAPVTFTEPPPGFRRCVVCDTGRAQERLRWKPRIPAAACIERTADWIDQNRTLFGAPAAPGPPPPAPSP